MRPLPDIIQVGETAFSRIDSPAGVSCWSFQGTDTTVSLVIEPSDTPSSEAINIAADVVDGFEYFTHAAIQFLCEQLRAPEYGLSDAELELLGGQRPPFESPEAVIWADGTWMLRFAGSSLALADEFGIGVNFIGNTPQSVETLSGSEPIADALP